MPINAITLIVEQPSIIPPPPQRGVRLDKN